MVALVHTRAWEVAQRITLTQAPCWKLSGRQQQVLHHAAGARMTLLQTHTAFAPQHHLHTQVLVIAATSRKNIRHLHLSMACTHRCWS